MRSLFLKVFLWFWLAMVLVIGALALTAFLTRPEFAPRPPQFVEGVLAAYSLNAVEAYERDGAAGLDSFMRHVERESHMRAHLFDSQGNELSGGDATPEEKDLAARAARSGGTVSRPLGGTVIEARPELSRGGTGYVFVASLPLGPPGPPAARRPPPGEPRPFGGVLPGPFNFLLGESTAAFFARLLAVVLTAGVLCYMLARYIVSPVVKLREVTRQVARGDLSARVGPALGKRSDELAAMGHDFDEMAARIETLVTAQNRLLRDISHELRSPLARLGVALDLARKRSGAEALGDLARIEREAERLNEMVGQLLALSRWESEGDAARRESVALGSLVREVASDADFEAQVRNRSVVVAECEECEVAGSRPLLRSAIENVVRNAVRYTPEATAVSISLRCERDGGSGQAVVAVRDEGAGVSEDALSDIFRPFFRVDNSRTRETGGTGLGLAITERAVRLHGGSVTASNIRGGGFVVELRLPLNCARANSSA